MNKRLDILVSLYLYKNHAFGFENNIEIRIRQLIIVSFLNPPLEINQIPINCLELQTGLRHNSHKDEALIKKLPMYFKLFLEAYMFCGQKSCLKSGIYVVSLKRQSFHLGSQMKHIGETEVAGNENGNC